MSDKPTITLRGLGGPLDGKAVLCDRGFRRYRTLRLLDDRRTVVHWYRLDLNGPIAPGTEGWLDYDGWEYGASVWSVRGVSVSGEKEQ